jgi:hypothetical protein
MITKVKHHYSLDEYRAIEAGENFVKQMQGDKASLVEKILKGENVKQD